MVPTMAQDVLRGLNLPIKRLSPKYFYDQQGSILFDQICDTPEYYLTRTEFSLLKQHASEVIGVCQPQHLLELGSGTSRKTRLLLDQLGDVADQVTYWPMDVSAQMLTDTAAELAADYPALKIHALVGDYSAGFADMPVRSGATLCLFLGSTLGNFEPAEAAVFMQDVRKVLRPGDYFLLGTDLDKDPDTLVAAYNDSQGLTADFNCNILRVINHDLGGQFDSERFEHRAIYNAAQRQIEMYLDSSVAQSVKVSAINLDVGFSAGETIWTEISRKFIAADIKQLFDGAGMQIIARFLDHRFPYALTLGMVD